MQPSILSSVFSLLALTVFPIGLWAWRQHLPERKAFLAIGIALVLGVGSARWSLWLRESVIHPLTGLGSASECIRIGWIAPLAEETVKGLSALAAFLVLRLIIPLDENRPGKLAMLGALVGAGFGVIEGLNYAAGAASASLASGIFVAQVRVIGGYLHVLASGMYGWGLGAAMDEKTGWAASSIAAGYGIHLANNQLNTCYGGDGIAMISFLVVLLLVLWGLFRQDP